MNIYEQVDRREIVFGCLLLRTVYSYKVWVYMYRSVEGCRCLLPVDEASTRRGVISRIYTQQTEQSAVWSASGRDRPTKWPLATCSTIHHTLTFTRRLPLLGVGKGHVVGLFIG